MALFKRLQATHAVSRTFQTRDSSYLQVWKLMKLLQFFFSNGLEFNSEQISLCPYVGHSALPWIHGNTMTLCSSVAVELSFQMTGDGSSHKTSPTSTANGKEKEKNHLYLQEKHLQILHKLTIYPNSSTIPFIAYQTSEIIFPVLKSVKEMDQREIHLQTLGICNKLYNFIKKTLMEHAFKSVTLGDPSHKNLFKAHNKAMYGSDQILNPREQQETHRQGVGQANNMQNSNTAFPLTVTEQPRDQDDDDANINIEKLDIDSIPGKRLEEEASIEAKPPKKAVSINDRVEEIDTSKKKIRRKKSKENLTSSEKEEDEPKPLKSILKVGSDSGEKSSSFVNPPSY